jgi:hypothetical protein
MIVHSTQLRKPPPWLTKVLVYDVSGGKRSDLGDQQPVANSAAEGLFD